MEIFTDRQEQRMSQIVAKMCLVAIKEYEKEKIEGTEDHFAIGRALSKAIESQVLAMTVRFHLDHAVTRRLQLDPVKEKEYALYEKRKIAAEFAEYLINQGLFTHEKFNTFYEEIYEVKIAVLKGY
jgi:hypothetical protein